MNNQKIYFEQVPVELAKKIAKQEIIVPISLAEGHSWQDVARAVVEETNPTKMMDLVIELNKILDAKQGHKFSTPRATTRHPAK